MQSCTQVYLRDTCRAHMFSIQDMPGAAPVQAGSANSCKIRTSASLASSADQGCLCISPAWQAFASNFAS